MTVNKNTKTCKLCHGSGACEKCSGTGEVIGKFYSIECPHCKGTGDCQKCSGSGKH